MAIQEQTADGSSWTHRRERATGGNKDMASFRLTIRRWHYDAFLPDFEGSQPQMKAKRAGSGQSRKNSQCFTPASKVVCGKALELIAGYRSFPPVGPSPGPCRSPFWSRLAP